MNPIALIAQSIPLTEQSMFAVWVLIALLLILDIAVIVFLFRVGVKRNAILTDYEETQVYDLTKRALVKAIEEYERSKHNQNNDKVEAKNTTQKVPDKTDDKPKSKIRIPYRKP